MFGIVVAGGHSRHMAKGDLHLWRIMEVSSHALGGDVNSSLVACHQSNLAGVSSSQPHSQSPSSL